MSYENQLSTSSTKNCHKASWPGQKKVFSKKENELTAAVRASAGTSNSTCDHAPFLVGMDTTFIKVQVLKGRATPGQSTTCNQEYI